MALAVSSTVSTHICAEELPYKDKKLPVATRVTDLLKRMTWEEKIAELNLWPYYTQTDSVCRAKIRQGRIGAFLKANGAELNRSLQEEAMKHSRLGIPLIFHEDVIHGYRTIFPVPLAESCSWNPELVKAGAAAAAKEASAAGIQLTYAPMVDICYDPRWGRILETSGEDSYLGSVMASARVKGFQGNDLADKTTVAACVKHFAGYGEVAGGRDYQETDISPRTLHEIYLPPFQAAIQAGVSSVMCSYRSYDGEPATLNYYMNTEVLRHQLGFQGLLMTDWTTFSNSIREGAVADGKEASERGIRSGIEMDMSSGQFDKYLLNLVKSGKVSGSLIDSAAYHALELKFRLGLFDDPYAYFDTKREKKTLFSEEIRQKAYEMACASMVLLKNEASLLPLSAQSRLALVGPFATNRHDLLGTWRMKGVDEEVMTVEEGFATEQTKYTIETAGCDFNNLTDEYIRRAVEVSGRADVIVACLGEPSELEGEATAMGKIEIPNNQLKLLKALRETGKKIVVVLFNGRPLALQDVAANCDALLEAWYPGTMGGKAVASLLTGEKNPSGKLTQSFPCHAGQIPVRYNPRRTFSQVHYGDLPEKALYPFGYGLSYTTYSYSSPTTDKQVYTEGDSVKVSVIIKNTGSRPGREIAQLYVRDEVSTAIPREKELKGFQEVLLQPGEEKTVIFTLLSSAFECFNNKMQKVLEPGKFTIYTGSDSETLQGANIRFQ